MALVNKNQPMREAEIAIADFINNRLTNMVRELAIPDENSIGLEKLDDNVKNLQTVITNHDITFTVEQSSDMLVIKRVTVKNKQQAIPEYDPDYNYVFNGAFASLNAVYNDTLKQNPVFVTTAVESIKGNSVTIAVILFILRQQTPGTVFKATLSTIWNCMRVDPR